MYNRSNSPRDCEWRMGEAEEKINKRELFKLRRKIKYKTNSMIVVEK